jgi:hypothetical protein
MVLFEPAKVKDFTISELMLRISFSFYFSSVSHSAKT